MIIESILFVISCLIFTSARVPMSRIRDENIWQSGSELSSNTSDSESDFDVSGISS